MCPLDRLNLNDEVAHMQPHILKINKEGNR